MKSSKQTKTAFLILISCIFISWAIPQKTYGALQRCGIRVDAGSSMTITFNVPVGTIANVSVNGQKCLLPITGTADVQHTWIRVVTDPGITPISFDLRRGSDPLITLTTPPQTLPVPNNLLSPIADAIYNKNTPATNVYSIHLNYENYNRTVTAANPETWSLVVHNNSSSLGIFAVYIGDTAPETEGPDVWLRDNATVDPSGFHTLSNINNLDTSLAPTPGEWWKSPAIRFTDQFGTATKNPVGGQPNNVYVQVRNFGTLPIASVTVEAFWANASAGLPPFPGPNWNPMGNQSQTISNIPPGEVRETGNFRWDVPPVPGPSQPNHYCVFARVAVSLGPLDPIDYSSNVVDIITPSNTNATHRNVMILSAVDPPPSGPFPFFFAPVRFYLTNPLERELFTELSLKGIPALARASQIRLDLRPDDRIEPQGLRCDGGYTPVPVPGTVAEGTRGKALCSIVDTEKIALGGLHLNAGEQRLVEVQFGLSEPVGGALANPIDAVQMADNKVMGGMTYVLDVSAGQYEKLVYVDRVVEFKKGAEGAPGANKFADPNKALGSILEKKAGDFVSLGGAGSLTVRSEENFILDEPGNDLTVFIRPNGIPEPYVVEVQPVKKFLFWFIRSGKFVQVGESNGETASFDLAKAGIKRAYGIRIIDKSGHIRDNQGNNIDTPGVDVVAIGLRHTQRDP